MINSIIIELFLEMVATLEIDKEGYTVPVRWVTLNSNIGKAGFGGGLCFI